MRITELTSRDFKTVQFESIVVNNTTIATSEIIICKVAERQRSTVVATRVYDSEICNIVEVSVGMERDYSIEKPAY